MLQLAPQEHIAMVLRRHWSVLTSQASVITLALVLPLLAILLAPGYIAVLGTPAGGAIMRLAAALWLLGLWAYAFLRWLDYYLDVWIITNGRVIAVEQRGLFHREISEIAMDRIQNVSVEVAGPLATVLGLGTIRIQTAGAGEFTIADVPNFPAAKDLILRYSRTQSPLP